MLKILTVVISVSVVQAQENRPGRFVQEHATNHFQSRHLINMTESLCKDAMYKLRMADLVQETYKSTRGYELGIIAAGLMDKYRHMIRIYRYYSNARSFKNEEHKIAQIMNAYSVMQSDYNELVAETVLYYQILDDHVRKDDEDLKEARVIAKKYGMSVAAVRDMQKRGVKLSDIKKGRKFRRSMPTGTELPEYDENRLEEKEDYSPRKFLLEDPMSKNINTWTPKKKDNNTQEEEYKKKLRYTMWAEKWNGFDGETEGVNIADTIARLGFANDSDFLLKELKGAV